MDLTAAAWTAGRRRGGAGGPHWRAVGSKAGERGFGLESVGPYIGCKEQKVHSKKQPRLLCLNPFELDHRFIFYKCIILTSYMILSIKTPAVVPLNP